MNYQAVILAAGKGTRMGDSEIPKVLHSLHGKPLIKHVLGNVQQLKDARTPIIVVGYKKEQVMAELGKSYIYATQDSQLGTAHAVLSAKPSVTAPHIIVLYGDMPFVSSESLQALSDHHSNSGDKITMFTTVVPTFEDQYSCFNGYGRIIRDTQGNIMSIREYKDATPEEREILEVNPGIYVFNTAWLWENSRKLTNRNAQGEYYITDMVELAITSGEHVSSLQIPLSEVFGINTKTELDVAHSLQLAW